MAGLRRYFKPVSALPTAAESGIGEGTATAVSTAVRQVIEGGAKSGGCGGKRKANTTFTASREPR